MSHPPLRVRISTRAPSRCALALGVLALLPAPAFAALEIAHAPVECLVAGSYPVIEAHFEPPDELARARVYFHAPDTPDWYYVEMTGVGGAGFEGLLPRPLESLAAVEYYIDTLSVGFSEARTQEFSARVAPPREGCGDLRTAAATGSVPSALVLGVPEGAPVVPSGFSGVGVAGSTAGAATAGAAGAATGAAGSAASGAATVGAAGTATAGGISTGLVVGGVAAGGAAVAIVATSGDDESEPAGPPDISGRWRLDRQITESCLPEQVGETSVAVVGFQQNGNALAAQFLEPALSGTLDGTIDTAGRLSVSGRVAGADGVPSDVRLDATVNGSTMSGTVVQFVPEFDCTISGPFSGSKS